MKHFPQQRSPTIKACSEVKLTLVALAGRCFHEHLDIFTEVEKPDTQPLIETPFGGRLIVTEEISLTLS